MFSTKIPFETKFFQFWWFTEKYVVRIYALFPQIFWTDKKLNPQTLSFFGCMIPPGQVQLSLKKITFFLFLSSLSMVDAIAQLFSFSVQSTEVKWLTNKIHKIFFVNLCEGFPSDQTVLPPTTPETLTFYFGIYCWNWISCHLCHSRNIWHNFHIILLQIVFTFACGSSCCFHLCMYYCIGIMVFG